MAELTEDDYVEIISDLSKSKEERIQGAFHLESALKDSSIKALGEALMSDPSPIVRHEFAFSLGETGHPQIAAEYLKRAVENDSNIFVRHEAILALATLGKEEFIPFVESFLADPEPEMAESAEIALERLKNTGHS